MMVVGVVCEVVRKCGMLVLLCWLLVLICKVWV